MPTTRFPVGPRGWGGGVHVWSGQLNQFEHVWGVGVPLWWEQEGGAIDCGGPRVNKFELVYDVEKPRPFISPLPYMGIFTGHF